MYDVHMATRRSKTLSREMVLRAAVQLADPNGVAGLSMRSIAVELDVTVMALYNHVANKQDLLEGMADIVAEGVEPVDGALDWDVGLRRLVVSTHRSLLAHPWAAAMWIEEFPLVNRWRIVEEILGSLAAAGFDDELLDLGFHALIGHAIGFARQQAQRDSLSSGVPEGLRRFESDVDPDQFPNVVRHVGYHRAGHDRADEFEFVLDLILAGLARSLP